MLASWLVAYSLLAVVVGSAVQTMVGAGLSIMCAPIFFQIAPPQVAVQLVIAVNLIAAGLTALRTIRSIALLSTLSIVAPLLAGTLIPLFLPPLPDTVLEIALATTLLWIALRRPHRAIVHDSHIRSLSLIFACVATGSLTVWTATPGPLIPATLARHGHSGLYISQVMPTVSLVAFGVAFFVAGPPPSSFDTVFAAALALATFIGSLIGYYLRERVPATYAVLFIRAISLLAAAVLLLSAAKRL